VLETSWVRSTKIAGHQILMVLASRVVSGTRHPGRRRVDRPPSDLGQFAFFEQDAEAFLHTPGGADLTSWVALSSNAGTRFHCLLDRFGTGQQPPAVHSHRAGYRAAAAQLVAGDTLPHLGEHLVR
jgi:hypothetical protein